jgi:hypothetical protein
MAAALAGYVGCTQAAIDACAGVQQVGSSAHQQKWLHLVPLPLPHPCHAMHACNKEPVLGYI